MSMRTHESRTGQQRAAIRQLTTSAAPSVSVYVHSSPPESPFGELALRWEGLRRRLAELGATTDDLDAITSVIADLPAGDHTLVAFAREGSVRLQDQMDRFDEPDTVVYGQWPHLMPLLRWQQEQVPTVVAVVHHGEADTRAYANGHLVHSDSVVGSHDEIERNAPGGWSQPRYRRRAEDSWAHNAGEFTDEIVRLARPIGARLMLLAGDVREVDLVLDRLPEPLKDVTVTRVWARPGSDGTITVPEGTVWRHIEEAAERERHALLAEFDEAVGQRLAVEGPADVRQALDTGAVRRLVVVRGAVADELADAMIAAALASDAEVLVAANDDIELVGGLGAILRF